MQCIDRFGPGRFGAINLDFTDPISPIVKFDSISAFSPVFTGLGIAKKIQLFAEFLLGFLTVALIK